MDLLSIIEVVNRTMTPLNFTFDGRPGVIRPGYRRLENGTVIPAGLDGQPATEHLRAGEAEMARRQNVLHGSEDRWNPHKVTYLIGVVSRDAKTGELAVLPWAQNEIGPLEQSDARERFDRRSFGDAGATAQPIPGSGYPRGRAGAAVEPYHDNEAHTAFGPPDG